MVEAWQIEHRPVLHFFLRRLELCRWAFRGKVFHKEAPWYARWRALYLALVGFEAERCCFCGWKVPNVWWCENQDLWMQVTGYANGGVFCSTCFESRAEELGITLRWKVNYL